MTTPLDALLRAYSVAPVVAPTPTRPSFSVIVRTQGTRPDSLAEALASIAAQTYPDHEVIVVVHGDGAATDTVRAGLPTTTDDRVRVVGVVGGGRARPLNTGLDEATNDYVCVLDDDDLARVDWLAAFATAATDSPSTIVRAVTESQPWATDGGTQPLRSLGPVERPFPDRFDLLAHMSLNLTPLCSLAFPRAAVESFGLRFDEDLAVYEDWDFLMRAAMVLGVTSVPDATSLYRRLDHGNADSVESPSVWEASHAAVVDRLSTRPVLLPAGDARRLARSHFVIDGGSRHEVELEQTRIELDALTRSPVRFGRAFGSRSLAAIRHRIAARRP